MLKLESFRRKWKKAGNVLRLIRVQAELICNICGHPERGEQWRSESNGGAGAGAEEEPGALGGCYVSYVLALFHMRFVSVNLGYAIYH